MSRQEDEIADRVPRLSVLAQLRSDQVQRIAGFFADVWLGYLREVSLETDNIRERGKDRGSCEPRSLARELYGAPQGGTPRSRFHS